MIYSFWQTLQLFAFISETASLIRNTLVIIITDLLEQDLTFSSNTFQGEFNADFAVEGVSCYY